jgi:chaperonin GroES
MESAKILMEKGGLIMAAKLEPLGDRVVVKPLPREEVTKGGIVLPDTAKEKPQEGEVIAIGPGRLSEDGKRIEMEVSVGEKVIYAKYAGTEIKIDDEELIILRENDILAKKSEIKEEEGNG